MPTAASPAVSRLFRRTASARSPVPPFRVAAVDEGTRALFGVRVIPVVADGPPAVFEMALEKVVFEAPQHRATPAYRGGGVRGDLPRQLECPGEEGVRVENL